MECQSRPGPLPASIGIILPVGVEPRLFWRYGSGYVVNLAWMRQSLRTNSRRPNRLTQTATLAGTGEAHHEY
ncbi:hypothetical protein Bresa_03330|uniref:Uncharacterized protein n=1 Tax=Brenneria salicis ATCC 15712 = DSM 30166 TaxID=714314 RepID=A0A366I403_9GAMM|nr:hypothetical protein [Brenneria salicis ATCC 15712 = DSM 30166]RBP61931.1 hypothetical protein DES54_1199 [Brenneria salicis ATCC 15712 = DSM 30166]